MNDEDRLHRLAWSVIAFGYACKAYICNNSFEVDDRDFLVGKGILLQEELDVVAMQKGWQPYYFLAVMRAVINQEYDALKVTANTMDVGVAHHMAIESSINMLSTTMRGMIRVKATDLPQEYNSFFLAIYVVLFTVASLRFTPDIGWWTPVALGDIYHVVRIIMVIGNGMEDPIGTTVLV